MSPELATILSPILGALAGAVAGWLTVKQKATLELRNQAMLAAENFEYSRGLQEHSQFIAKKHEVVAELHRLLVDAFSKILNIEMGRTVRPRLDDANEQDLRKLMDERQVLQGIQEDVLALWPTDRAEGIRTLLDWLEGFEKEQAQRSHIKAKNFLLNRQIYISTGTYELAMSLVNQLEQALWRLKPPLDWDPSFVPPTDREGLFELQKRVIGILRQELNPEARPATSETSLTQVSDRSR